MRLYPASGEETLRARGLLKDWLAAGLLSPAQFQTMEPDTACDLRRTNIFLRLVLLFFTLLIVGAAAGLFFVVFLTRAAASSTGVFLLIFALISYAAAEFAVSKGRLYRYGIEEGLAVCSVAFLCTGLWSALASVSGRAYSPAPDIAYLVPAAGALASLWIWHRFGLWYAFPAAMIFVVFLPAHWTSSLAAQHVIIAGFYGAGLALVAAVRSPHCFDYLDNEYSLVEAFLWLGIYLACNLQFSSFRLFSEWSGIAPAATDFSRPFYWTTWVLCWCLPVFVLLRGVRRKDRFVMIVGALSATLTLVTNKLYLGWQQHSWDPMLLGALFVGVALFLRRWLASAPGGIRHGFTAERVSAKDPIWITGGSAVVGLLSPQSVLPGPQPAGPDPHFGGGDSGGGGATSDF